MIVCHWDTCNKSGNVCSKKIGQIFMKFFVFFEMPFAFCQIKIDINGFGGTRFVSNVTAGDHVIFRVDLLSPMSVNIQNGVCRG